MRIKSLFHIILPIFAGLPLSVHAQTTAIQAKFGVKPLPKPDCTKGAALELDFWIGDWKVTRRSDGAQFGVNHFRKEIGGCAIRESFEAKLPDGSDYLGTSISFYDPIDKQWYQFWVDNGGRRSVYAGNMKDGEWIMIAPGFWPERGAYLRRMTVRRNPDGSVRQLGAISTDNGQTWTPTFDLDYTKL